MLAILAMSGCVTRQPADVTSAAAKPSRSARKAFYTVIFARQFTAPAGQAWFWHFQASMPDGFS